MESKEVVAGGDARPAVDDRLACIRVQGVVVPPQLGRRAEDGQGAIGEVGGVRGVPGAGDVAGPRVDGFGLAAIARGSAGVEDQAVAMVGDHLLPVGDPTRPESGRERGGGDLGSLGGGRAAFGQPFRETAVEKGDGVMTVGAQDVPEPRRDGAGLVIVGHHANAGADPDPTHHAAHLRLGRPGMPAPGGPPAAPGSREVGVQVEEHGPGDVAGPVGVSTLPGGIQVPAHVEDAKIGLAEPLPEPSGVDEGLHGASYFWRPIFAIGESTFL